MELCSDIQGEFQRAPLGAGDMEAVEALMSLTNHRKAQSFKFKHPRPLTPSSDCSEDDSAHLGFNVLQEAPLVRNPCRLRDVIYDIWHKMFDAVCALLFACGSLLASF